MTNIEKKSRMVIGILAILALLIFLATTFGSSTAVLYVTVAIGLLISALLFIETGIVRYFSESRYKKITFADIMVFLGTIAGVTLLVFSVSLIPQIGEVLPEAITNFTTTFARTIAVISIILAGIFIATPKFE